MSNVRVGTKAGLLAAIMSNFFLGFSSLYWKALGEIPSISLLGYRVFFSMLCVTLILLARKELKFLLFGLELRDLALHGVAALLVACNWGVFIWSSIHGRVFESGLGYLIAPILGVGLGVIFYKEYISFFRGVIVFFVVLSVFFLIFRVPGLDFRVYLSIGVTWGMYTWLKKMARLDAMSGLFIESFMLTFIAVALISYFDVGLGIPDELGVFKWSLLLSCGLVSLVPLALFAFAAKHLPLSVMGLLQFVLPLTQFCVASAFYGQSFTAEIFLAFSIIFAGMLFIVLELPIKKLLSAKGWSKMSHTFHVVVVGLGVMGSAAVWRLSQQGVSVLGLDSGAPINVLGSSYGSSRIFRQAYWEGLDYLPVLKQADKGWRELQAVSVRSFLYASGGLFIGSRLSGVVSKSVATAKAGCIGYRRLTSSQVAKKFSAFHLSSEMEAVFEDGAYTIAADDAHLEMLNQAVVNGAQLRYGCRLDRIERIDGCLGLKLADGQTIKADRVILATGASLANSLIPDLGGIVRPVSVPVYWFNYKFGCERGFVDFPAFLYELHDGRLLYGTPQISQLEPGVKIGFHNHQQSGLNMDNQRFPVSEGYVEEVSECVASILSGLSAQPYASKKCIYTLSPDDSFLLGESKELPGVYYISACSGHGFKFAPEIGNYMARAVRGESLSDIASIFSIARFDKSRLP